MQRHARAHERNERPQQRACDNLVRRVPDAMPQRLRVSHWMLRRQLIDDLSQHLRRMPGQPSAARGVEASAELEHAGARTSAWRPAWRRTPQASYMTHSEKVQHAAKSGSPKPSSRPMAAVSPVTWRVKRRAVSRDVCAQHSESVLAVGRHTHKSTV